MAPYLVLFLIVVVLAFIAAWRVMPSGYLTAATGSLGAIILAAHEAVGGMMPELKASIPEEHRIWLTVTFLLLTVAARFRNKVAAK